MSIQNSISISVKGEIPLGESIDPIFNSVVAAYPLSEATSKMRREVLGSGDDLMPEGITLVSGASKAVGTGYSYMAGGASMLGLSTDSAFMITFTLKPTALSGTRWILTKGVQVAGNTAQYSIYHSASTITFRLFYGAASQRDVSATLTNGVDNVVTVGHDPVNNVISIKVNNGSVVTTAHSNGTKNFWGPLTLCAVPAEIASATKGFNGSIKNLIFWNNRYLTSAEQTYLYTYLTTTGFPWATLTEQDYYYNPDDLTSAEKREDFDFTDFAYQWQDIAQTIPVTANDDPIRRIVGRWGNLVADAPSDAVRPLAKTATINSYPSAYTNGTDSLLTASDVFQSSREDFYLFVIAKNDKNASAAGSHWVSYPTPPANNYMAHTGSDYVGGYLACHIGGGVVPSSNIINNPTGFNTLEFWGLGTQISSKCNGGSPSDTTEANNIRTNNNPVIYQNFFKGEYAAWWALGNIARVIFINKTTSISLRARIRNYFKIRYNMTNVHFEGY